MRHPSMLTSTLNTAFGFDADDCVIGFEATL